MFDEEKIQERADQVEAALEKYLEEHQDLSEDDFEEQRDLLVNKALIDLMNQFNVSSTIMAAMLGFEFCMALDDEDDDDDEVDSDLEELATEESDGDTELDDSSLDGVVPDLENLAGLELDKEKEG